MINQQKAILKIYIFLFFSFIIILSQDIEPPAHHTGNGFRNPFPTFESNHGFISLFKWSVIERIRGVKPDRPDEYNFEVVHNDGSYIKENIENITITWIGHSTLLIQIDNVNILTDPIWSDRCSPVQFIGPKRHVKPGIDFTNLPEIDLVIISHDHYDHLDKKTIEKLGNKPFYLIPLGLGDFFDKMNIVHYLELDWWDFLKFNGIEIICTPAQHFSGRNPFNQNNTLWCGWLLIGKDYKFYFAGDTGYFPGFKEIRKRYGPVDISALPIGAYIPRWFMAPVHLSPEQAIQAYLELGSRIFIPIHWGTFELADEPLDQPLKVLINEIENKNLPDENFWLLKHGETRTVDLPEINLQEKQEVAVRYNF